MFNSNITFILFLFYISTYMTLKINIVPKPNKKQLLITLLFFSNITYFLELFVLIISNLFL